MLLIKRRLPDYVYWRPQSRPRDGRLALDGAVVEGDRPQGFKAPERPPIASRLPAPTAATPAAPLFIKKKSPLPFIGRGLFLSRREGRFSAERGARFDRGARIAVSRRDDFFGGFSRLDGLAGPGDMEAVTGAGRCAGPVGHTDPRHAE